MRVSKVIAVGLLAVGFAVKGWSQERVAMGRVYERLWAVVPMIGAGTYEDPQRPAYVPGHLLPGRAIEQSEPTSNPFETAETKGEAPKAIISFNYVLSDDSRFALVEFQATDRSAFEPLVSAARDPGTATESGPNRNALDGGFDLKVFEIGKAKQQEIEEEFRKHKKDFKLDEFQTSVP